jgi:hypothetical protein
MDQCTEQREKLRQKLRDKREIRTGRSTKSQKTISDIERMALSSDDARAIETIQKAVNATKQTLVRAEKTLDLDDDSDEEGLPPHAPVRQEVPRMFAKKNNSN